MPRTTSHNYLILGDGMIEAAASDGIREVDSTGRIGLICAEQDSPYDCAPLTKGLWKGKSLDSAWRDLKHSGLTIQLGRAAQGIAADQKCIRCTVGGTGSDEQLLLATGG